MAGPSNTQFAVAVHVLTYLAGFVGGRPISSDELAESANVNPVYVRRVLGPLREAGIVESRSGAHGGWGLGRPADEIGLDGVWACLCGAGPVISSHGPNPDCPVGAGVGDVLGDLERSVTAAVVDTLRSRSVADVLAQAVGSTRLARRTV